MKKKRLLAIALLSLFASGCLNTGNDSDTSDTISSDTSSEISSELSSESSSDSSSETSSSQEETLSITDYYPFEESVFYSYIGDGNEFATFDRYPQYIEDNKIQWTEVNPGATSIFVVEYADGQLTETYREGNIYYRENMLDKTNDQAGRIILKEPLEVGTAWENPDGSTAEITAIDMDVETTIGVFPAIEVTSTGETGVNKFYYAEDMGLIKQSFGEDLDNVFVSSTLQSRNADMPQGLTIKVFYPDANAMGIETSDVSVSFFTNDVTRNTFTDLLKQVPDVEFGRLIPENATINTLYLNNDGRVYVDFSEELVTEMNAGSSGESLILQGIVNTIGHFYGVEEIILTVEQAPYESGHYMFQPGEPMFVDWDNVAE